MTWKEKMEALQAPFNWSAIKWRIQQAPKGEALEGEADVLAYVSNRAIQNRLDQVFGVNGWKNEYKEWHKPQFPLDIEALARTCKETKYKTQEEVALSYYKQYLTPSQLCGISVWDDEKEEWVTKWDGADGTNFEETKGGLSDSMKRAAYHLGIGRYLYDIPSCKTTVKRESKWKNWYIVKKPQLPQWAYDQGELNHAHIKAIENKVNDKGLKKEQILAKYMVEDFDELTLVQFQGICKKLDRMYEDVMEGEEPKLKEIK